jgi:hypothetical protein
MGLKKIVVLCVAVVVIAGALWLFFASKGAPQAPAENAGDTAGNEATDADALATENDTGLSGVGSMFDLLALGRSISCTYSYSDENGSGSGTGYFDGDRMRIDSDHTEDGKTFETHVINDGTNLYSWTTSSEGSFAFVTRVEEYEETPGGSGASSGDSGVDTLNEAVEYDCDSWRVDANVFVPPSNIEFVDMSAMMQWMMQGIPEGMMPEAQ